MNRFGNKFITVAYQVSQSKRNFRWKWTSHEVKYDIIEVMKRRVSILGEETCRYQPARLWKISFHQQPVWNQCQRSAFGGQLNSRIVHWCGEWLGGEKHIFLEVRCRDVCIAMAWFSFIPMSQRRHWKSQSNNLRVCDSFFYTTRYQNKISKQIEHDTWWYVRCAVLNIKERLEATQVHPPTEMY